MIEFKFKHMAHDQHVLHEREVRKALPPFDFLRDAAKRAPFFEDLNVLIQDARFTIVAAAIRKEDYTQRYPEPINPYHLALEFCLERLYRHLHDTLRCDSGRLCVVFEGRGAKEDAELELEFRRTCDKQNHGRWEMPFDFVLSSKRGNSTGLQLADLVARPIGLHVLRPDQPNRAWDLLKPKLRRSPSGRIQGWGLKVFP